MATRKVRHQRATLRPRVTETVASTWLRSLRDGRAYQVPVGSTWRASYAPPGHRWAVWVPLRAVLTWEASEEDFRQALDVRTGRYYLEALAPDGRRYRDNGLAYVDTIVDALGPPTSSPQPGPLPLVVIANLRARAQR